jgi:SAM-dependent methyltransferase
MLGQRPAGSAPAVQASAAALPFPDDAFAASLAILTVHHWADRARGLDELARVARDRVVLVTWDPASRGFWLVDEYFPEILAADRTIFPSLDDLAHALGRLEIEPLPVPHDCVDGFLGAYWRRPDAYLDAGVRGAISTFSRLADPGPGLARLGRDLRDGTWARRHAHLLGRAEIDLGYRIVVAVKRR